MEPSTAMDSALKLSPRSAEGLAMQDLIDTLSQQPSRGSRMSSDGLLEKERSVASVHVDSMPAWTEMEAPGWGFVVVQGEERIRRYCERARVLVHARSDLGVVSRGVSDLLESESFRIYFDVGALVAVYAPKDDRYAEADCWLAGRSIERAALARGLGVCSMALAVPMLRLPEIRAELRVPSGLTCYCAFAVGAPREVPPAWARSRPGIPRCGTGAAGTIAALPTSGKKGGFDGDVQSAPLS